MPLDAVSVVSIKHEMEVLSLLPEPRTQLHDATYKIFVVCISSIYKLTIRLQYLDGGDIVMNKEMVHSDIWTGSFILYLCPGLLGTPGNKPGPALVLTSKLKMRQGTGRPRWKLFASC